MVFLSVVHFEFYEHWPLGLWTQKKNQSECNFCFLRQADNCRQPQQKTIQKKKMSTISYKEHWTLKWKQLKHFGKHSQRRRNWIWTHVVRCLLVVIAIGERQVGLCKVKEIRNCWKSCSGFVSIAIQIQSNKHKTHKAVAAVATHKRCFSIVSIFPLMHCIFCTKPRTTLRLNVILNGRMCHRFKDIDRKFCPLHQSNRINQ